MKLRKLFSAAAMALLVGVAATAQTSMEDVRIYINPGHGSWGPNNRHMATVKHPSISTANPDTTDFYESNTNLQKGLAMLYKLVEYGVPFDPTKNQTNDNPNRIGAALDLTQNIVMSHVKCGPYPYSESDNTTDSGNDFNRTLSVIAAEVDANDFDMFVSIHSNAATDGNRVNYLYFAWDNSYHSSSGTIKDGYSEEGASVRDLSIEMAMAGWNHRIADRHANWSHYDVKVSAADFAAVSAGQKAKIGWQNLGVLNHTVPGYLVEGYFHTYQPLRHRYMNWDVCHLEGVHYARGIADYFGWEVNETKGEIYGVIRDLHEKFTHDFYTPAAGSNDVYKPLNDVDVALLQGNDTVATYKTDDEYNGVFVFKNLEPGEYIIKVSHPEYKEIDPDTVVVTSREAQYPEIFIENVNYVPPTITYVNYPDSTAGKEDYVLKSKYKLYSDGEFDALAETLKDKTIRRTILRYDTLYVLAVDSLNAPTLLVADAKNNKVVAEISTEGCEGTHMNLSDIQVTADGYLLGCSKEWNQYSETEMYTTGDANHTKYGYGDVRGECWVYKWEKDANGYPTGNPIQWVSTQGTGNWFRAIVGETFAYTGTLEEGQIVLSAQTATAVAVRNQVIDIADGVEVSESYSQPFLDGVAASVATTSLGETYKYVTSPLDEKHYFVVSSGDAPIYECVFTHGNTVDQISKLSTDVVAASTPNVSFFKYAGKSLMVAPDMTAEGKVAGIKLVELVNGLDSVNVITLTGAAIEPVECAYAAAHGKLDLEFDAVTGYVSDAQIDLMLITDANVVKLTAEIPAAKQVTPGSGTANPFAYELDGAVSDKTLNVSYKLNVAAASVRVVVKNEAGDEVASAEGGAAAGANTAVVALDNVATGTYNWEVEVTGDAKTTVAEFVSWNFYHPCGIDVDNSMESPSFGTLFVAEGYTDGKTTGYVSAQADGTDGGGLYMFNPAGEGIKNEATGAYRFYGEGLTHSKYYNTSSSGGDFSKVAVAEDGRVFVTRYNTQGDYILSAPSVAELAKTGKLTSLVAGLEMTDTKVYLDADSSFLVGPVQSFDVKGSGEDTKLLAITRASDACETGASLNRIVEYSIGTAESLPTPEPTAIDMKYTISYDKSVNIAYDNRGGIWYCQYRGTPDNSTPALVYVDESGEEQYFEGVGGKSRRRAAVSVSPDGTRLVAASAAGYFSIYDIEVDEVSGAVELVETYCVKHGMGNNLYALAWDAAGNVYGGNASGEYVKGFSTPRANNAFATKAASKYAFEYVGSAVETILEDANAPVEYYNLQGIKVENPSKGIYIKKQGRKTTKVVL